MQTRDLTTGGVTKTLLKFTVPFFLANLLQTLYGIVDLIIVGQFASPAEIAAVSVGSLVMATVNLFIMGLTAGGTVLVGLNLGAGRDRDVKESIASMFGLYTIVGVLLVALLLPLSPPLLRVMKTPADSFSSTLVYVRVCVGGVIFTTGYNAIAAALRGLGDSKNPLLFVAVACVVNIIGDIALVGGLELGAFGAALATVAAQGLSMLFGIVYLKRREFSFKLMLVKEKVKALLRLGIPISLQDVLVMFSFLVMQMVINDMGSVAVIAAAGICDKIFNVANISSTSFASSISAMVAQNIGAEKPERVRQSLKTGLLVSFAVGAVLFALAQLAPEMMIRVFNRDAEVIREGSSYLKSYSYEYLACSLVFCMNGFINGCGHTRFTLINNIVSAFVIRLPLIFLFARLIPGFSLFHIGIALPLASLVQGIGTSVFIATGRWKKRVKL